MNSQSHSTHTVCNSVEYQLCPLSGDIIVECYYEVHHCGFTTVPAECANQRV